MELIGIDWNLFSGASLTDPIPGLFPIIMIVAVLLIESDLRPGGRAAGRSGDRAAGRRRRPQSAGRFGEDPRGSREMILL